MGRLNKSSGRYGTGGAENTMASAVKPTRSSKKRKTSTVRTVKPLNDTTRRLLLSACIAYGAFVTGCSHEAKSIPNDGRPCLLTIVGADTREAARALYPYAKDGDALVAGWCMAAQADMLMNEITRLAH